jgi:hypothetical protein
MMHRRPQPNPGPVRQDSEHRDVVYRVDADDRICFVNDAWLDFADANAGPSGAEGLLGSPILSHISDAETRHIYRLLLDRARAAARPVRFRYRCDSPELRRLLEMHIRALPGGQVEFCSRVLRLEPRAPVRLLDPAVRRRRGDPLQICSWCKAVLVQTAWLEVEAAMQRLGASDADLPPLSHGICPACSDRLTRRGGAP